MKQLGVGKGNPLVKTDPKILQRLIELTKKPVPMPVSSTLKTSKVASKIRKHELLEDFIWAINKEQLETDLESLQELQARLTNQCTDEYYDTLDRIIRLLEITIDTLDAYYEK